MIVRFVKYQIDGAENIKTLGYFVSNGETIKIIPRDPSFVQIAKSIQDSSYETPIGVVSFSDGEKFMSVLPLIFRNSYFMAINHDPQSA